MFRPLILKDAWEKRLAMLAKKTISQLDPASRKRARNLTTAWGHHQPRSSTPVSSAADLPRRPAAENRMKKVDARFVVVEWLEPPELGFSAPLSSCLRVAIALESRNIRLDKPGVELPLVTRASHPESPS